MAKKKTTDEIVAAVLETTRVEEGGPRPADPVPRHWVEASAASLPRLESYINQHDETPRALATVRLEGGGPGDGTYLVDHPVPRAIGHRAARYVISREDGAVTVYIWVNP